MLLIETQNVSKHYDDGTVALENVSVSLKVGEILGLLGPNGAGKTTLMHIMVGLLSASNGKVSVLGYDPLLQRHKIAPEINFSSAYIQLPPNLKVMENMLTFARLYNVHRPRQKIETLLDMFGMAQLKDRLVGALSSGEKTRLNLCKCFLNDPELVLLDEPTASLDPEMGDTVRSMIRTVQRERNLGVIYTSHNMREIEELCDRIVFIHHGKIIAQGGTKEVLSHFESADLDEVFIKVVRG